MEDLVQTLTRGNVTEVKVVLASVAAALAVYQVVLIAVGYGKMRLHFLAPAPAARAHRASGDAILVIAILVAVMCLSVFGFDDDGGAHAIAGVALLSLIAVKVVIVRRGRASGRYLPLLGISVFVLFALTWATSAGEFLADR